MTSAVVSCAAPSLDLCPGCNQPTHASESDDHGLCTECSPRCRECGTGLSGSDEVKQERCHDCHEDVYGDSFGPRPRSRR